MHHHEQETAHREGICLCMHESFCVFIIHLVERKPSVFRHLYSLVGRKKNHLTETHPTVYTPNRDFRLIIFLQLMCEQHIEDFKCITVLAKKLPTCTCYLHRATAFPIIS